jgi:hypothetical protein
MEGRTMNAMTNVPWKAIDLYVQAPTNRNTEARILAAEDGRQIGVMYGSKINPRAASDHVLIIATPQLRAALAELTAALDEAMSATNVSGAVWSSRMICARDAAEAALGAVAIVEPRR